MNTRILKLIAEVDEFKGFWKGMQSLSAETLSTLRVLATIESIGSSTRIEGARLSDSEVSALMRGLDMRSFRSRDEQEVAGYTKAIELIQDSYRQIDLTQNNIKYLHRVLLQFSDKDDWHLGEYKKHPNHVAAFDSDGNQIGIIFETTPPAQTPLMMESLVDLTRNRLLDEDIHPLLTIADFVLRFLAIHPFQDGNGRLARVLTNLVLMRSGYDYILYSSHERVVEANKDQYYLALRESQKNLKFDTDFEFRWAEFFLEMLVEQKNHLMEKIERERRAREIPALSEKILHLARQHGRINIAFISKVLEANRNTVKKHVAQLVKDGRLMRYGRGRGTYYSPP